MNFRSPRELLPQIFTLAGFLVAALSLLTPCLLPIALAQGRTAEMVQPSPIGFRNFNAGFSPDNKSLYYVYFNNYLGTSFALKRYDLSSRRSSTLLGPLGKGEQILAPRVSATGRYILFTTSVRRFTGVKPKHGYDPGKYVLFDTISKKVIPLERVSTESGNGRVFDLAFSPDDSKVYLVSSWLKLGDLSVPSEKLPALVELTLATGEYRLAGEALGTASSEYEIAPRGAYVSNSVRPSSGLILYLRNETTGPVWTDTDLPPQQVVFPPSALRLSSQSEVLGAPNGNGFYHIDFGSGAVTPFPEIPSADHFEPSYICTTADARMLAQYGRYESWSGEPPLSKANFLYLTDILSQTTTVLPIKKLKQFWGCALDPSGRYLTFSANSTSYAPQSRKNDSDLFRYELASGEVLAVSTPLIGTKHDGWYPPRNFAMSPNGRFYAFTTGSSRMVRGDRTVDDLFLVRLR